MRTVWQDSIEHAQCCHSSTLTPEIENRGMFSVQCPRHGSEVLLSERRIVGIDRSHDHLTVRWVCWCGHHGSHRTGRPARSTTII
jgi:hypothetical protein